jgi:hypothetical protein
MNLLSYFVYASVLSTNDALFIILSRPQIKMIYLKLIRGYTRSDHQYGVQLYIIIAFRSLAGNAVKTLNYTLLRRLVVYRYIYIYTKIKKNKQKYIN